MNRLLPVNETPSDIINVILDLVIDIKIENLEFDVLKMLLKQGHNKKLIRDLLFKLLDNDKVINLYKMGKLNECKYFIADLIELNELGLAIKFFDLLDDNYQAAYEYGICKKLHNYYIDKFIDDEILFERLFKMLDPMRTFAYFCLILKDLKTKERFVDLAIKYKKDVFLVLYCYENEDNNVKDLIKKYDEDETEQIWEDFISMYC